MPNFQISKEEDDDKMIGCSGKKKEGVCREENLYIYIHTQSYGIESREEESHTRYMSLH